MARSGTDFPVAFLDAAVELMSRSGPGGTVRVSGASMVPTLREGQVLAVEFAAAPYRRGDLLLFRQQDYLVVHRLLGPARPSEGRPRWRTRGDATPALDPALDPARVIGRVVALRDAGGWRACRSASARAYGAAVAWHDLFWAALASLARRLDEASGRRGGPRLLLRATAALDRGLLHAVHLVAFRLANRRIAVPPTFVDAGGGVDETAGSPGP